MPTHIEAMMVGMDLRELDGDHGDASGRLSVPAVLALERVAERSQPPYLTVFSGPVTRNTGSRVFGGQVLGQVVAAAARTLPPGYPVHHASGQFVRPADGTAPLRFHVKHERDGRVFALRTVEAIQHDRLVFTGLVSGHVPGRGVEHQIPRLVGPGPEDSPGGDAWYADWPTYVRYLRKLEDELGVELRFPTAPVHVAALRGEATQPQQSVWVRCRDALADLPEGSADHVAHAAALAYLSDLLLLGAALGPHRRTMFDQDVQVATINHAIWLHAPTARADEWLRVEQWAPWSGNGMAMCRSELFALDGRLIASVSQESLIWIV
ncbi:MAG: thioesterase family protein [Austwickia sp.]|nr:thioesterase family protein [Austwickia sp.]